MWQRKEIRLWLCQQKLSIKTNMNEIEEGTIELEKTLDKYLKDLDDIHRRITNDKCIWQRLLCNYL